MLISEPIVGSFHRIFGCDVCLFFCGKSCYECSDLSIVRVRDRKVGVVPSFLHSLDRELKHGNPTKHVSITAVQVHELLAAVEEHIGCALHEESGRRNLLQYLTPLFGSFRRPLSRSLS